MRLTNSLALITLYLVSTEAVFGLFKAKEPKRLARAKGDTKETMQLAIDKWNGSIHKPESKAEVNKKDAHVYYFKPKKVEGKKWSRIYLKKKKKYYAGMYAQLGCSDSEKIEESKLKEALKKSLDQKRVYTVKCGGTLKEGKVY